MTSQFALGTFSLAGCPPFAGLVLNGREVIAVSALRPLCNALGHTLPDSSSTLSLLEQWDGSMAALQAAANELRSPQSAIAQDLAKCKVEMSSLRVHPPVASRQIILCGANYFKHVVDIIVDMGAGKTPGSEGMNPTELRAFAEQLMRRRQTEGTPYIFSKPVSVLSGAYDPIRLPAQAKQPDWELELTVVMGSSARHVHRADAHRYIAGYTIANDITNRDLIFVKGDMKAFGSDWIASKSSPTYLPVGPYIVPRSHVVDPQQLHIELKLNGEVKQSEYTSDMIFDIARLIEYVSGQVQLWPGDLICTGSPAGNGTHYNRYLQPGDVIEGTISGLGQQRTPVIAERN